MNLEATVIIPVFNGGDLLIKQLECLAAQDAVAGSWELLVCDNGSSDETVARVRMWLDEHPNVVGRVVSADEVQGPSHARNCGALAASTDRLLFCDADDEVDTAWVREMNKALYDWDVVGGPLRLDNLNDPRVLSWRRHLYQDGDCILTALGVLKFVQTANFGVKRSVYLEVGMSDTRFAASWDDVDLCHRVSLAGFSIGEAPRAIVDYRFRPSLGEMACQFFSYGQGEIRFRRKRLPGVPRLRPLALIWQGIWDLRSAAVMYRGDEVQMAKWLQGACYRHGMLVELMRPNGRGKGKARKQTCSLSMERR